LAINSGLETVKGAQSSPESCAPPDFLFGEIMLFKTIHGMWGTSLYRRWKGMKGRCNNKNNISYKNYGGRGITICDEWKNNPKSFFDWALAHEYRPDLEIDRIDNNGNYTPENCRFVTHRINSSNIRKKSGLPTGVCRVNHCKKYIAQITLNKKWCYLGAFNTPEEAGKAYQACIEAFVVCKDTP